MKSPVRVFAMLLIVFAQLPSTLFAGDVKIIQEDHALQIQIDGKDFATYSYLPEQRKPYFLPVKAADGTVLTRALHDPEDDDHRHHKGVWLSVDEINGVRYWMEAGRINVQSVEVIEAQGTSATFEVTNHWLTPKTEEKVITDKTRITIFDNRLMAWDIQFIAEHGRVEFNDTKEGLLGYRMTPSMKERITGKVISSDGTEGTKNCWGRAFPWIDYSGTVGDNTYGVTLMDHPDNFRKSRYHVRDYGLFSVSPFGEHAYTNGELPRTAVILEPNESLRLRYAIYFHDGDAQAGSVAEAYDAYVDSSR